LDLLETSDQMLLAPDEFHLFKAGILNRFLADDHETSAVHFCLISCDG
jgi:hypothetical protein